MGQHCTALERAAELAARHHLLARVAALLEVHAADRLVVEHLRHEGLGHGGTDRGHAGSHLAQRQRSSHAGPAGSGTPAGASHSAIGNCRRPGTGTPLWHHPVPAAPRADRRTRRPRERRPGRPQQGPTAPWHRSGGPWRAAQHRQPTGAPAASMSWLHTSRISALAALETDEAGLHAALRGAEGGQPGLGRAEQQRSPGSAGRAGTRRHPGPRPGSRPDGQRGTARRVAHGVNYHPPIDHSELYRPVRRVLLFSSLLACGPGGRRSWWLDQPLAMHGDSVDLSRSTRAPVPAGLRRWSCVRASMSHRCCCTCGSGFRARHARSGPAATRSNAGTTPRSLLRKLVRGEESLRALTLVEGWTFRQVRAALARAPQLRSESAAAPMPPDGAAGPHGCRPGGFFPRHLQCMPRAPAT
jgi:hypothetical protein